MQLAAFICTVQLYDDLLYYKAGILEETNKQNGISFIHIYLV